MINNTSGRYTINLKTMNSTKEDISIENIDKDTAENLLQLLENKKLMSLRTDSNKFNDELAKMFSSNGIHAEVVQQDIAKKFKQIKKLNNHRGLLFNPTYTSRVQAIMEKLQHIVDDKKNNLDTAIEKKGSGKFGFSKRTYSVETTPMSNKELSNQQNLITKEQCNSSFDQPELVKEDVSNKLKNSETNNIINFQQSQQNYNALKQIFIAPLVLVQRDDVYQNGQLKQDYIVQDYYDEVDYLKEINDNAINNALSTETFRYLTGTKNRELGGKILHVEFHNEDEQPQVTNLFANKNAHLQVKVQLDDIGVSKIKDLTDHTKKIYNSIEKQINEVFKAINNESLTSIVVNCKAGQSRSAAFAYALEYIFGKQSLDQIKQMVENGENSVTPHPVIMNQIIVIANKLYGIKLDLIPENEYCLYNTAKYSKELCGLLK